MTTAMPDNIYREGRGDLLQQHDRSECSGACVEQHYITIFYVTAAPRHEIDVTMLNYIRVTHVGLRTH